MKLAALALMTTLGFGGIASADPAGPPPRSRGELRQLLLQRFDRDHDGVLDARERRHAIRALRRIAHRMAMKERRDMSVHERRNELRDQRLERREQLRKDIRERREQRMRRRDDSRDNSGPSDTHDGSEP